MHLLLSIPIVADPDAARAAAETADWFMLFFYLALALGVSFLCSLLEAGLLTLPTSHVHLMVKNESRTGPMLQRMKDGLDRPLAAILTLNTIAHTIGAAGVGAQILIIFGNESVALGSVIVTLLILVFSEIIPKSLGAAQCKRLAPFTAFAVQGMIWITLPLLIPLQWVSSLLGGGESHFVTRDEVAITAELGEEAGQLDPKESRIIRNLLRLRQVPAEDVMTPRPVIFSLPQDMTVADVVSQYPRLRYSRIPIHAGDTDKLTGLITRHNIMAANNTGHGEQTLAQLAGPLTEVHEDTSVAHVLDQMVQQQTHLFRIIDEFGGTAGLITQEDCFETLLGVEIVDETDSVDDLREAAREKLKAIRQERDEDEK